MEKTITIILGIFLLSCVVAYSFEPIDKVKKIKTKEICDMEDEMNVKEKKCKTKYPNDVDVDLDVDSYGVIRLDFMGLSG